MLRADDLEKGQLVVVADYYGQRRWDSNEEAFPGDPLEIVAVSLPFIIVFDGVQNLSLDTRMWGLIRVSKEYARAFHTNPILQVENLLPSSMRGRGNRPETVRVPGSKARKAKRTKGQCPRCNGNHVVRRLVLEVGNRYWIKLCKDCGWNSDPKTGETA